MIDLDKRMVDAGGADGAARFVELDIDTDVVLENLTKMSSVLDTQQKNLLAGFDLEGAWSSSNASLVTQKVAEINESFAKMQEIITKLINKVNGYVEGVKAADTVTFKENGE